MDGRPITILFTDVQGSTQLRARHGDRVADEMLRDHEAIVRRAIGAHGGVEAAFLGDGFMATFSSPAAGLRCAIAVQQGLQRTAGQPRPPHPGPDRAAPRRGRRAATAPSTVRPSTPPPGSCRRRSAARSCLTAAVRDAVEATGAFSFVDRGLYWLRGFSDRWRLYEAEWGRDDAGGAIGPGQDPVRRREPERADLRRAVEDAAVGHGSLRAGLGRGRGRQDPAVQEIDAEADARGLRVLTGHSAKDESRAPYLPFTEMIEQGMVTPRSPATLRQRPRRGGPEIARIAPALRLVVPRDPGAAGPPARAGPALPVAQHARVHRAGRHRTPAPARLRGPALGRRVDPAAAGVPRPCTWPDMPVMLVGTFRDDEVEPSSPLAGILNQLVRQRLVSRIGLRPLTEDGVAALVAGLGGRQPPAALVRGIYAQSEGNPFFAEEIYLHLAESGVLFDDQGRFRRDLRVEDLDVPSSVRMVVGERLARLSQPTQRALVAAAVRGRVFELDLVEQVAGEPGGDLLDAFDEAERARLITPSRSESSSYTFDPRADPPDPARRRLDRPPAPPPRGHRRALEAIHADDLETHAADLAYHLAQGGGRPGRPARPLPAHGRRPGHGHGRLHRGRRPFRPGRGRCSSAGRAPRRRIGATWPSWSSAWPWPCAARAAGTRRSRSWTRRCGCTRPSGAPTRSGGSAG
jgi:hypothetical protein